MPLPASSNPLTPGLPPGTPTLVDMEVRSPASMPTTPVLELGPGARTPASVAKSRPVIVFTTRADQMARFLDFRGLSKQKLAAVLPGRLSNFWPAKNGNAISTVLGRGARPEARLCRFGNLGTGLPTRLAWAIWRFSFANRAFFASFGSYFASSAIALRQSVSIWASAGHSPIAGIVRTKQCFAFKRRSRESRFFLRCAARRGLSRRAFEGFVDFAGLALGASCASAFASLMPGWTHHGMFFQEGAEKRSRTYTHSARTKASDSVGAVAPTRRACVFIAAKRDFLAASWSSPKAWKATKALSTGACWASSQAIWANSRRLRCCPLRVVASWPVSGSPFAKRSARFFASGRALVSRCLAPGCEAWRMRRASSFSALESQDFNCPRTWTQSPWPKQDPGRFANLCFPARLGILPSRFHRSIWKAATRSASVAKRPWTKLRKDSFFFVRLTMRTRCALTTSASFAGATRFFLSRKRARHSGIGFGPALLFFMGLPKRMMWIEMGEIVDERL